MACIPHLQKRIKILDPFSFEYRILNYNGHQWSRCGREANGGSGVDPSSKSIGGSSRGKGGESQQRFDS